MAPTGESAENEGAIARATPGDASRRAVTLNQDGETTVTNQREHSIDGNKDDEIGLKYGAAHVINLFVPVSLCMAVVILTMLLIGYYSTDDGVYLLYTPFTKPTDNAGELFVMSVGNALTMLGCVVVMTFVLILLYKFRFYKVIHGWLLLSSLVLLSVFTIMYLQELFKNYNIPLDYISLGFFIWNYGCVGIICIHWKGPLLLEQCYLIVMSALMALIFIKFLPDWSVWTVLAMLSLWDLVAVLCPNGPLRILVETAQERNEPIFPALIYSSGMLYLYFMLTEPDNSAELIKTDDAAQVVDQSSNIALEDGRPSTSTAHASSPRSEDASKAPKTSTNVRYAPLRKNTNSSSGNDVVIVNNNPQIPPPSNNDESVGNHPSRSANRNAVSSSPSHEVGEHGVKLGLGDFIFYSVLVGKASSFGDWNTTIACYVAILVGLAFTLMLLAVFRKALPALPISIFAGMTFYFATRSLMSPFVTELSLRQYVL